MPVVPPVLEEARPPRSSSEQPQELQDLLTEVRERFEQDLQPFHKQYEDEWDDIGGLYHSFDQLRKEYRDAPDRDAARGVLLNARNGYGTELFIPTAFATIETVVPRIVSNAPKMLAKPLDRAAVPHRQAIADFVNQQQRNVGYESKLQPTVRRGLKLGLGIQKLGWREKRKTVVQQVPFEGGGYAPVAKEVVLCKGPMPEDVDVYDFFWDPTAKSIESCNDILHRTWRPFSYVKEKVESGEWFEIDLEAVEKMGRSDAYVAAHRGRWAAQGLEGPGKGTALSSEKHQLHEVWEYHRGDRIVTILDDAFVVVNDVSGLYHREYPFAAFRPIMVEGQLPGIGVISPIRDLIRELNTLRTQRRDNATIKLNPPIGYAQGFIARKDIIFGPGSLMGVQGDPREALHQFDVGDIPASGYQEEVQLKQDLEMTSGISEAFAGGTGSGNSAGTETATGMQLIAQAAGARINLMARNLLNELVTPHGWQWLNLNRQYFTAEEEIRIDDPSEPDGYRFVEMTPEVLAANVELVPEEHSTEPENRVQRVNDAMTTYNVISTNPIVDQRRALKYLLEEIGIRDPETFFAEDDTIPAEAVVEALRRILIERGMPEEQAAEYALEVGEAAAVVADELDELAAEGGMDETADGTGAPPVAAPPEE